MGIPITLFATNIRYCINKPNGYLIDLQKQKGNL